MIIKIKSHKRDVFQKILEYMLNDKDRLMDKEKSTFTITHNLKGKKIKEWVNQYKANELLRTRKRKDSVRLTHEILSWHMDDSKNITLKKMDDITREYIRQRNPNGIFLAVPHFDKEHYHIHICASGVEYKTGKSLRLSKVDLQKLKKGIQEYQIEKFPELSKSIVVHDKKGRSLLSEKEYQFKLRTGRVTNKELVLTKLKKCLQKTSSKETFLKLLETCNLKPYERSGKTTGIIYNEQKFRFKNLGINKEILEVMELSGKREKNLTTIRESKLQIDDPNRTFEK